MDIVWIIIYATVTGIVLFAVACLYIVLRSLIFTGYALTAKSVRSFQATFPSRQERLEALPALPFPIFRYSLASNSIDVEDLPGGGTDQLLDCFEQHILSTRSDKYALGRLKSVDKIFDWQEQNNISASILNALLEAVTLGRYQDKACASMMVIYTASPFTRFVGWITLEDLGSKLDWHLICSEVRLFRTPNEEASHFDYDQNEISRFSNQLKGTLDNRWIGACTNLLFSGFTTQSNAKKAELFKRFLLERWDEALNDASAYHVTAAMPAPEATETRIYTTPRTLFKTGEELNTNPETIAAERTQSGLMPNASGVDLKLHQKSPRMQVFIEPDKQDKQAGEPPIRSARDRFNPAYEDWTCSNCGEVNFGIYKMCSACNLPKARASSGTTVSTEESIN